MKLLNKTKLNKITEGWSSNLIIKYKSMFKDFFSKLKDQFKHNAQARTILLAYIKSGYLTKEQAELLKQITFDTMKMVGLGGLGLAPIPGGTLLMLFLINGAKKLNINLIPSQFENLNTEYIDLKNYDLTNLFHEINNDCFNGELELIDIIINRSKSSTGMFQYTRNRLTGEISNERITISNVFHFTEQKLKNVLAHEMLHYWIAKQYPKEREHHGPRFIENMNRINALGKYTITIKDDEPTHMNLSGSTKDKYIVFEYKNIYYSIYKLDNFTQDMETRLKRFAERNQIFFNIYITTSNKVKALPMSRSKISIKTLQDKYSYILKELIEDPLTEYQSKL